MTGVSVLSGGGATVVFGPRQGRSDERRPLPGAAGSSRAAATAGVAAWRAHSPGASRLVPSGEGATPMPVGAYLALQLNYLTDVIFCCSVNYADFVRPR